MDTPAVATPPPPTPIAAPTTSAPGQDYANFGYRLAAWLIDIVLQIIVNIVVSLPFGVATVFTILASNPNAFSDPNALSNYSPDLATTSLALIGGLVVVAINTAYYTFMVGKFGQTPGKMILKIKIVDQNTNQLPSYGQAFKRYLLPMGGDVLFRVFSLLVLITSPVELFDCLWMLWDPNKQTLHDKIAGTVVVKV